LIFKRLIFGVLIYAGIVSVNAEEGGWNIGLGIVSSDLLNQEAPKTFFPVVRSDNKQYMLIPSLRYEWDRWSVGADGIRWKAEATNGLKTNVRIGFPASGISVAGQKGWFRYGLNSAVTYSNGIATTQGVTAGPLSYSATLGVADRGGDLSQKVSLGFPLFISKKTGITVIGSGFIQYDNSAFTLSDLDENTALAEDAYQHAGLNAFGIYKINEQTTFLLSASLQWNDASLVQEINNLKTVQFNIFSLISYSFGD